MNVIHSHRSVALALGAILAGGFVAATGAATAAPQFAHHAGAAAASTRADAGKKLVGTFTIQAGKEKGSTVSGSYFRMITPVGAYFANTSSKASPRTYTLLAPGKSKGLTTGKYQSQPKPAFDSHGNSLAAAIIKPTKFEGVNFSVSTNKVDPQTGTKVPAPTIRVIGDKLSGNLSSFAASWNKQNFNQGSPKPDGKTPGRTTKVTGTYNARTHRYTLTWKSQIVGGPFNTFTGLWVLTGTFDPA